MHRGKFVAAVLAGGLVLAGCQSAPEAAIEADALTDERRSDPIKAIGPGGELTVEAGEFYFELQEGLVVDGDVSVTLDNVGGALHNFRIDAATGDRKKVEAPAGETAEGTLNLFAGEYVFYCDVPGHRSAGMEGTLIVYPTEEEATPVGPGPSQGGGGQTDESVGGETESPAATESPQATETATDGDA